MIRRRANRVLFLMGKAVSENYFLLNIYLKSIFNVNLIHDICKSAYKV